MRKNQNSVQESQIPLKVAGQQVAVCSYAKGPLCRRAYWLIPAEGATHVLVQYFCESNDLDKHQSDCGDPIEMDQDFKLSDIDSYKYTLTSTSQDAITAHRNDNSLLNEPKSQSSFFDSSNNLGDLDQLIQN